MLAHNQGQRHNAAALARGLDVNGVTIARYLDLMVDLLLIRRLVPWTTNLGRRLVKAPKVYVRDSGVCDALLGIETMDDLFGHPVIGGSWEGFVIENIASALPERASCGYYRTSGGAEVDLVVDVGAGELWAIEIKHSSALRVSRGLHSPLPGPPACPQVRRSRRQRELSAREGCASGDIARNHRAAGAVWLSVGTCGLGAGRRPIGGLR